MSLARILCGTINSVHRRTINSACNDIKVLGKLQTDLLIMDEVQRLKNWNTQISIAMRKVESDYSVILSGTPLENRLEELYSVMEFADQYCLAPYWRFKADCIVSDANGKVIGYQNLNRIGEKTRERLIRRTKKQVALQMPARQDKNLFVPMTKEQREAHDELRSIVKRIVIKWKRMHFLTETDRKRLLLCLSQMRMLCDSTFILDRKSRHDTNFGACRPPIRFRNAARRYSDCRNADSIGLPAGAADRRRCGNRYGAAA